MDARLRIAVIVGSTRQGRVGDTIARWFVGRAERCGDLDLDVLDLADFDFPQHYPEETTTQMTAFTTAIDHADGFVVVTPEYNRSFPASLKQAIDYAYDEWHAKPVGFVAYGCRGRGHYAVQALRVVFAELHTMAVRDEVGIDLMRGHDDRDELAVTTMLDQLVWWARALRDARAAHPYIA
ncbi:NADPH-dependent FMN reductase [Actinophytocola sp.]|uniref:NADPH-dependent FMN reductase n=1 Tax=Actinophytocola sp. TaxID=1872138 RepID=UPI003D6C296B